MNTQNGIAKLKSFCGLLDIEFSSTILIRTLITKINHKGDSIIQWNTQLSNITTNLKDKIYFILPQLSTTKTVTEHFHVGDSSKGRYDIIVHRNILTDLGINLKLSYHIIKSDDDPLKRADNTHC